MTNPELSDLDLADFLDLFGDLDVDNLKPAQAITVMQGLKQKDGASATHQGKTDAHDDKEYPMESTSGGTWYECPCGREYDNLDSLILHGEKCDVVTANELLDALATALMQLPQWSHARANAIAVRDAWWTREYALLWAEVA